MATLFLASVTTPGCDPTSPSPHLEVEIRTHIIRDMVVPTDDGVWLSCDVGLTATADGEDGARAEWGGAAVLFFGGDDRSTPVATFDATPAEVREWFGHSAIEPEQEQALELYFRTPLPFHGELTLEYLLEPGGEKRTAEVAFDCGPPAPSGPPPTVAALQFDPAPPEPGYPFRVEVNASSGVGLWSVRVEVWSGPWSRAAYALVDAGDTAWTGTVEFFPDWTLTQGQPVNVRVTAMDVAGQIAPVVNGASQPVVDRQPPGIGLLFPCIPCYLPVGDTLRIDGGTADASAYTLEYRLGSPAVHTGSLEFGTGWHSTLLELVPEPDWAGTHTLSVRAVDAHGQATDWQTLGEAQVIPRADAGIVTTEVAGRVTDLALDLSRDRVYLARPDHGDVLVLSATDFAPLDSLEIPGAPHGVDLDLAGDRLIVALRDSAALVRIDPDGVHSAERWPVEIEGYAPLFVRTAANGRWIVHAEAPGDGLPHAVNAAILVMDPLTGAQSTLVVHGTDPGNRLLATDDRSRILTGAGCLQAYEADTGLLGSCHPWNHPELATDADGTVFSDGWFLFDAVFTILDIDPPATGWIEAVDFSPDGARLLVATTVGVDVVDVASWKPVLRLDGVLPGGRMEVSPDGRYAIAWGRMDLRPISGEENTPIGRLDLSTLPN